jgi:hypothetical protein
LANANLLAGVEWLVTYQWTHIRRLETLKYVQIYYLDVPFISLSLLN